MKHLKNLLTGLFVVVALLGGILAITHMFEYYFTMIILALCIYIVGERINGEV